MITEKRCATCREIKPIKEFNKRTSEKDGYSYQCKLCHSLKNKKDRLRNSERVSKYRKEKSRYDITNLTETYVKNRIQTQFGIPAAEQTPEIIEEKREALKIMRLLKQIKEEEKDGRSA